MMKKILLTLSLGFGLTFGVHAQAVTKAEKKAQIMRERDEAMKEPAEATALFDAKEVNLAGTVAAPAAATAANTEAAPIPETAEKVVLKESEVPLHVDAVKEKAITTSSLPRLVISLSVVFSLMGAGIFALKKWSKKRTTNNSAMKIRVLTQHHLGPKKSIAIIQVAGESILVGITDHNISMLKTLALIDDEIPQGEPNKFDDALYNFEEEQGEIGQHFSQKTSRREETSEPDDFALRGISEIRDVVSRKLKGMRQME
jgi:flagellar protein FliO/FliZ